MSDELARRRAETIAPYTAVIRHTLGLRPGADALAALDGRLSPEERGERPPVRAPGIVRLRHVVRDLRAAKRPEVTLEQLTEDLRFLRLFERPAPGEPSLDRSALLRLLDDVRADQPGDA